MVRKPRLQAISHFINLYLSRKQYITNDRQNYNKIICHTTHVRNDRHGAYRKSIGLDSPSGIDLTPLTSK
jgi:hypothetical protein